MKTLGEILQLSTTHLKEKKIPRARREAEEIVSFALKIKRLDLYLQYDRPLEEQELTLCRQLLKRASSGEPLEYIFGEKEFYHCQFCVTPKVLIPRQETEILLDIVVHEAKPGVAWDVCCGSGCLGIALKKAVPSVNVTLSDISQEAIELAKKNAERNHVDVFFETGDLLTPFKGKKADLILCNPPYISQKEFESLDFSVRNFEPKIALIGGESGLEYYRRLAEDLPRFLNPGAKIYFEIGASQGGSVLNIFSASCWRSKQIRKDWSNLDRFFSLEFE